MRILGGDAPVQDTVGHQVFAELPTELLTLIGPYHGWKTIMTDYVAVEPACYLPGI